MVFFALTGASQALNARYLAYVEQYKDIAMEQCRQHGVPASITLAQGLLESNAGASYLATRGNNHFGIKCHKWAGESVEYDDTLRHECYRKYAAAQDSYLDHSRFLCGKRYQSLHQLDTTDYRGWAHGLKQCGYAEDPGYPSKLIAIIERYQLSQYDSIAMLPVPKHGKHDKAHKPGKQPGEVPPPHKKEKKESATVPPRPGHDNKPEGTRRQHNQRTTTPTKPLNGSADNDD